MSIHTMWPHGDPHRFYRAFVFLIISSKKENPGNLSIILPLFVQDMAI